LKNLVQKHLFRSENVVQMSADTVYEARGGESTGNFLPARVMSEFCWKKVMECVALFPVFGSN